MISTWNRGREPSRSRRAIASRNWSCCRSCARRCRWWILSKKARAARVASAIPACADTGDFHAMTEQDTAAAAKRNSALPGVAPGAAGARAGLRGCSPLWLAWSGWRSYARRTPRIRAGAARDAAAKPVADAAASRTRAARHAPGVARRCRPRSRRRPRRRPARRSATAGPASNRRRCSRRIRRAVHRAAAVRLRQARPAESAIAERKAVARHRARWRRGAAGLAAPAMHGRVRCGRGLRAPAAGSRDRPDAVRQASRDDSYLALRQGSFSVVERGDKALANGAEVLATPVPGTTVAHRRRLAGYGRGAVRPRRDPVLDRGAGAGAGCAFVGLAHRRRDADDRRGADAARTSDAPTLAQAMAARRRRCADAAPAPRPRVAEPRRGRGPGADRQAHLPRLRHPRHRREDARHGRRRTDRPVDRFADGRQGPARHRRRPRRPPVGPGHGRRPRRRPAQGGPQRHRHRPGGDAGGVFRRLPAAHRLRRSR